jgi:hypothetical protein
VFLSLRRVLILRKSGILVACVVVVYGDGASSKNSNKVSGVAGVTRTKLMGRNDVGRAGFQHGLFGCSNAFETSQLSPARPRVMHLPLPRCPQT